eukprot:gene1567-2201_t
MCPDIPAGYTILFFADGIFMLILFVFSTEPQRGFSPETVDPMGNTLLHAAVGAGALQTAKTVVHWAVKAYQPPNVAFLSLTNSLKQTPLAIAQEKGHVHVIEWLMTLGDPDDESTPQLRGPDPHHGSDPAYHFATSEGSLASAQASKGSVEKALEPSQTTAIVPGLALPDHMLVGVLPTPEGYGGCTLPVDMTTHRSVSRSFM